MPTATRIAPPRPALIAVLGVLVLAVTFFLTKAGDNTSPSPTPVTTTTTATATGKTATTNTGTTATTTTTAKPAKPAQPTVTAGQGLPDNVARALNSDKVVVLFFYEPAASDDQATLAAVRAVRSAGGSGVALFQDTVSHISDYRRLVGSLGISQTPVMVVIDHNRHAALLQGYLDSGTIRQTVRDAL